MKTCVRPLSGVAFCVTSVMLCTIGAGATLDSAESSPLELSAGNRSTKAIPLRSVDIVIVIDNSSTMGAAISSLQNELYDHLAAPLDADDIDVRVIIVANHGDLASESVCIESPLSSVPPGGCTNPPVQPGITNAFKHYSVEIGSLDAWCLLISAYDGTTPDEFALAPAGWSEWLRDGAFKVVLVVSDDGVMCGSYDDGNSAAGGATAAAAIDSDLLVLSSLQFGTSADRNFVAHALVGLAANAPPEEPWPPTSPITASTCAGAVAPGTGHQGLATLTGGLRFPVCSTGDFDDFFDAVAVDTAGRVPIFADGFESTNTDAWSMTVP